MDHRYRNVPKGLLHLGEVSQRTLRDEFQVIVDDYAAEAVRHHATGDIIRELAGWARSFYTLEGHMEAIMKYDRPKIPEPSEETWNRAKQFILTEVRRWPKCQVHTYKDFDSVKWLRSSAAGYGYVGKKGENDNYHRAKQTAVTLTEKLVRDPNYGPEAIENSTPDVAFTRTQLSQIKVKRKVRNVWGEAFHYNLVEGLFADPLIEYFISQDTFYFIGKDPLLSVPALIQDVLRTHDYVYTFDWSAFDSSVQEWELRFAFHVLEQVITFPSSSEKQIWHFIVELFIYRKIACPDGSLFIKTLGIPSGSCFTNMIGSIVNYSRIQFLFLKLTDQPATVYTHGDDSFTGVTSAQRISVASLKRESERFNWDLNDTKTRVSRTAEGVGFLSRTVREGHNFREELICLRMLMYPEYPVLSGDISSLRAKSIAKDSGLSSPLIFKVYKYLKRKHGIAEALPLNQRRWDPQEYELLRQSHYSLL